MALPEFVYVKEDGEGEDRVILAGETVADAGGEHGDILGKYKLVETSRVVVTTTTEPA